MCEVKFFVFSLLNFTKIVKFATISTPNVTRINSLDNSMEGIRSSPSVKYDVWKYGMALNPVLKFINFLWVNNLFLSRFPSLFGNSFDVSNLPIKESDYWPMLAYNQSKLCNVLFAFELNRLLSPYGVFCNALHPGNLVYTQLQRNSYLYKALYLMCRPFSKSQVCMIVYRILLTSFSPSVNRLSRVGCKLRKGSIYTTPMFVFITNM